MKSKNIALASSVTLAIFALTLACATSISAQTYRVLHNFGGPLGIQVQDGANPYSGVIFDAQGNLYGTTANGGVPNCLLYGCGTGFELTPNSNGSWKESILSGFEGQGAYGGHPVAPVVLDRQGNVYGTVACAFDCFDNHGGGVFELVHGSNGSWTDLTVASYWLEGGECADAVCGLTFDPTGHLYLASRTGVPFNYAGAVVALGHLSVFRWYSLVIYSFTGGDGGHSPTLGLIADASGDLYGTTSSGGTGNLGVVYQLKQSDTAGWMESVLYSFQGGSDGASPSAGVIFDAAGNLYGTTAQGGSANMGTVYKLTHNSDGSWTESVLYAFQGGGDASAPNSSLSFDTAGNLYGTAAGGAYSHGAVFKLTPLAGGQWTESVVYSFTGGLDGDNPSGGVVLDAAGNLYGTMVYAGAFPTCADEPNCGGVAYEITP